MCREAVPLSVTIHHYAYDSSQQIQLTARSEPSLRFWYPYSLNVCSWFYEFLMTFVPNLFQPNKTPERAFRNGNVLLSFISRWMSACVCGFGLLYQLDFRVKEGNLFSCLQSVSKDKQIRWLLIHFCCSCCCCCWIYVYFPILNI